jgi:hypothetical protein
MARTKVSLASYLSEAALYSCEKGIVTLAFCKKFSFHKEIVESFKNIQFIEAALEKKLGKRAVIRCILIKDAEEPVNTPRPQDAQQDNEEENEFINQLLDTFDGNLHTDID